MIKETINAITANQLISEQFPKWADLPVIPVSNGGWDNRTFHLGQDKLLRFPSSARYAPQVIKERKWLPFLAPQLSSHIPTPLGFGHPGYDYKWNWAIYNWISGETAASYQSLDKNTFAKQLGAFLSELYKIPTDNGPISGEHNFHRGGNILIYEEEAFLALKILSGKLDVNIVTKIWKSGAVIKWCSSPVWVHGDISPSNLIIENGDLKAVIDFGLLSVGDPACDLAISWTFLDGGSRKVLRDEVSFDDGTWERGQSWVLWKSLIITSGLSASNKVESAAAQNTIKEIIEDYKKKDL